MPSRSSTWNTTSPPSALSSLSLPKRTSRRSTSLRISCPRTAEPRPGGRRARRRPVPSTIFFRRPAMNQPIQAPTLPPGAAALAEAPAAPAASALPELSRFREAVERRFRAESPDTFWSLEEAFRQLVVDGTFAAVFNRELRRLLDDPCYMGNWRANQIVLNRGRGHVLSIWLFDQPRRYIHSTPYYGMFAPLGAESLYYDVYRLPENYRNAQFDPEVRLEPAGSGFTAPGGVLLLDSDRYVYDFKVERPLAVAKFSSAAYQTL